VRAAALCVATVALIGCDRRPQPAAELAPPNAVDAGEPALDCGSVIAHLRTLLVLEFSPIPGAMGTISRACTIADRSCRRDQWPLSMRRCARQVPLVGAGGGTAGLSRCLATVPAALRATLEHELNALRD
jgi:hypothetical protein